MSSLASAKSLLVEDARLAWGDLPLNLVRGRRFLVTGASGLLGSHFLAGLLEVQRQLNGDIGIDAVVQRDLPAWFAEESREGRMRVHQGDLAKTSFVDSLPSVDCVIHAATYSQPALFTADPVATIRLNTSVTLSLLDKLEPGGRCLFLSSSEVYSGLEHPPYREEQIGLTNTTHARACYIEGKRCGEAACFSYQRAGIQARAARLCLAYGPGTRPGDKRVLNTFIERALRQGRIQLMDDGSSRRAYCYISDAMFMLWRILLCGRQPVYNVGGTWHTSVWELAQQIGRILQVPVEARGGSGAGLAGAPQVVAVDCSRFQEEFGQRELVPAERGIERTIGWQRFLYATRA